VDGMLMDYSNQMHLRKNGGVIRLM